MKLHFTLVISLFLFFPSFLYSEQNRLQKIDIELQNEINKEKEKYNKSSLVDYERLSRYKKELHSITNDGVFNTFKDIFTSSNQESRKKEAESFLNSLDTQGKTPLMYAIQFNDSDTVEEMFKYGADPNIKAADNKTALLFAFELANENAKKNQNEKDKVLKIFDFLLLNNADVNYSFNSIDLRFSTYTPLIAACLIPEGNDKCFKQTIIEKILNSEKLTTSDEVSIFTKSNQEYQITPLAYLCTLNRDEKYQECIDTLLDRADVNKTIKIGNFEGQIVQYLCANYDKTKIDIIKSLIQAGADIDSSFTYKNETLIPLICAVRSKDNDFINSIVNSIKKTDNAKKLYKIIDDKNGSVWECSAFHIVAKSGNKDLYKKLKDKGFSNSQKDSKGNFAINYLKETCITDVDKLFLTYDLEGNNSAAIEESISRIKNLKEEKTSNDSLTVLQVMLSYKDEKRAINLLNNFYQEDKNLSQVFSNYASNEKGNAFDYAVRHDCYNVIKWFIDNHISIERSVFTIIDKLLDSNNENYLGILESFLRIVEDKNRLVKRFEYTNKEIVEASFIPYTVMMGQNSSQTSIQEKIIEKLIENNVDINSCTKLSTENGNSALIYAIKNKNEELAMFLIEKGINLDLYSEPTIGGNDAGKTAIFYALEKRMDTIVESIIKKKEMILEDKKISNGQTLLMYFAQYSNAKILKALLPYYIQKNNNCMKKNDDDGLTPFLYAITYNENIEVAKLLRMYGADVNISIKDENAVQFVKKSNLEDKDSRLEKLESWGVKKND